MATKSTQQKTEMDEDPQTILKTLKKTEITGSSAKDILLDKAAESKKGSFQAGKQKQKALKPTLKTGIGKAILIQREDEKEVSFALSEGSKDSSEGVSHPNTIRTPNLNRMISSVSSKKEETIDNSLNEEIKLELTSKKKYYNFSVHGKKVLYARNSCCCFTEKNRLRYLLVWLIECKWFDIAIMIVILANSIALGIRDYTDPNNLTTRNQIVINSYVHIIFFIYVVVVCLCCLFMLFVNVCLD